MTFEEVSLFIYKSADEEKAMLQLEEYFKTTHNEKDENSKNYLFLLLEKAAWLHCNKVLTYLLQKNQDINICNQQGKTILMVAVSTLGKANIEAVQILLNHKADPSIQDETGYTALHYAVGIWPISLEVIQLLVSYGARIDLQDEENWTPCEHIFPLPCIPLYEKIIEYFISQGALLPLRHISQLKEYVALSRNDSNMLQKLAEEGNFLKIASYADWLVKHMRFLVGLSKSSLVLLKNLKSLLSEDEFNSYQKIQQEIQMQMIKTISGWADCSIDIPLEDIQCYISALDHNNNLKNQWGEAVCQLGNQVLLPPSICNLISQYLVDPIFKSDFEEVFQRQRSLCFSSDPQAPIEALHETNLDFTSRNKSPFKKF